MIVSQLDFSFTLNSSLQVGDEIYYYSNLTFQNVGGFSTQVTGNAVFFGTVVNLNHNQNWIQVLYDDINVVPPLADDYIMFVKDKKVNTSSLVGYYAEMKFENNTTKKAELFSVGSNVSESSK